jgi:hypothetical protein
MILAAINYSGSESDFFCVKRFVALILISFFVIFYCGSAKSSERQGVFGINNSTTREEIVKRFSVYDCVSSPKMGEGPRCEADNYLRVPGSSERYPVSEKLLLVNIEGDFFGAIFSESGLIAQLSMLSVTNVIENSVSEDFAAELTKVFDKKYQKQQSKVSSDTNVFDGMSVVGSHKLWRMPKENIVISLTSEVDRVTNKNKFMSEFNRQMTIAGYLGNSAGAIRMRARLESYGYRKNTRLDYFFADGHAAAINAARQPDLEKKRREQEESKSKLNKF